MKFLHFSATIIRTYKDKSCLFSRNAVRRVADAMNGIDEKKRKDKFGNSFHYVHGPRKS
jgi:hypothetical protein